MDFVIGAIAVIGATVLVFSYLVFIWWLDRYEREPFWLVLFTFAYGGIFGTFFGCMLSILPSTISVMALGAAGGGFVGAVIVAPIIEEFTKGLVFGALVLSKHFDNETDGLIYGAATGLGFACVENLLYFASAESVDSLVGMAILRTLFTAIVHCSSSAALGMAIGFARHRGGFGRVALLVSVGYAAAVANHAVWNGLATASGFDSMQESGLSLFLTLIGCSLVMLSAFVMFALTQISLKREHDTIKRFLILEAQRGTMPAEHAEIIPYWLKRRKSGWLPGAVDKEAYIEAATLLAFRQHQLEHAEGSRRERILREIEEYRSAIAGMLTSQRA